METALEGRVAQDIENRRSKQFWLACQNLQESIVFGQKAGSSLDARRKPLGAQVRLFYSLTVCPAQVQVLGAAAENDSFVSSLIAAFPKNSLAQGVFTEQDLKERFGHVSSLCLCSWL